MFRLGLFGSTGRMGQAISQLIETDPTYKKEISLAAAPRRGDDLAKLMECNVVIDFSQPEALATLLSLFEKSTELKTRLVSGTTGLNDNVRGRLTKLGERTAVLYGANMSMGVRWLHSMFRHVPLIVSRTIEQAHLTDIHHAMKKDAPSGTALALEQSLKHAKVQLSEPITSLREGEEIGTHRLTLRLPDEMITIEHRALSRRCFAQGAIEAARWLVKKNKGYFPIEECEDTP
jgi:4-hydroxy-tetrahydrodipicolinate reductase